MTDKNGLYHKFIQELIKKTEGNTLIILLMKDENEAETESKKMGLLSIYEKYLYDPELIEKLAHKGFQPSVEILAKNFMVFLVDS